MEPQITQLELQISIERGPYKWRHDQAPVLYIRLYDAAGPTLLAEDFIGVHELLEAERDYPRLDPNREF